MSTIKLKGYDVYFPYPTPYDIQKDYMEKVISCLDQKTHAVLESPTGTGKTLCLFAPVTAWTKHKKLQVHYVASQSNSYASEYFPKGSSENVEKTKDKQDNWGSKRRSKVWYTARTHSQIAQTIGEVRKCDTEGLHVRVMGARDQLCINNNVLAEKDSYVKTVKCKELVKNRGCKYFNKLNYEKEHANCFKTGQVLDIEDLVSLGKTCGICPYFLAKKSCEGADIVLLPYNYIIESESRESNGIYLQDDVIIFDEGHNIPQTCEENYELSFSSLDIALGIKNVKDLMLSLSQFAGIMMEDDEIDLNKHANNAVFMLTFLQKLESGLEELKITNDLLPVQSFYDFFDKTGIAYDTARELLDGIQGFKNDSTQLALSGSLMETFKIIEKMMNVIFGQTVRSFHRSIIEKSFKWAVTKDPERMNNVKKVSLYCFNPSFGIKSLLDLGVQSVIITSGTLSPLKTFITELGLPNPITLENGHIAKKCQVPFVILGAGVNNVKMDGAYKNRDDPSYKFSLGMTLTNLISSIPDGILLLFSSYSMMQNLKQSWEAEHGVWTRLNALKRVFVEPRNKEEFINCMENYRRSIDAGNGAILMGVLRGKISEGMDFKDQYCRGVFIIGVPFPPVQDPRVQGKEKYSESLTLFNPNTKLQEKLYNNSFMSVEAMKATNQAIGRVIRHGKDYGVIFLVDYRFAWPRLFTNISSWLRGSTPVVSNFPAAKKLVREFFKSVHSGEFDFEEVRCQSVDANGCPIASYISYEEYDHAKHSNLPIGSPAKDETKKTKCAKSRGDFKEKDEDLISLYKIFQPPTPKPKDEPNSSSSLLDVLENSRSSSVGYREFDKNKIETNKRKLKEDDGLSQYFPFSERKTKKNKYPKFKLRPLVPSNDDETLGGCSSSKPDENIKVKLINYYRKVKQSLSIEGEKRFKEISCRYMKGEAALTEVIKAMDELFLSSGNKNLFLEFDICVKGKDKDEWVNECKSRKLNLP